MPTEDESMSFDFDPDEDECTACDDADMVLTEMDWEILEDDGYELVCDPACLMDGCGAFGLPTECRAVPIEETPVPAPTPVAAPVAPVAAPVAPVAPVAAPVAPVAAPVSTGEEEGEGGGEDSGEETGEGEGEGGGEDSGDETGEGEGEGGGEDSGDGGSSCTADEIAMCADISPAQVKAVCVSSGIC